MERPEALGLQTQTTPAPNSGLRRNRPVGEERLEKTFPPVLLQVAMRGVKAARSGPRFEKNVPTTGEKRTRSEKRKWNLLHLREDLRERGVQSPERLRPWIANKTLKVAASGKTSPAKSGASMIEAATTERGVASIEMTEDGMTEGTRNEGVMTEAATTTCGTETGENANGASEVLRGVAEEKRRALPKEIPTAVGDALRRPETEEPVEGSALIVRNPGEEDPTVAPRPREPMMAKTPGDVLKLRYPQSVLALLRVLGLLLDEMTSSENRRKEKKELEDGLKLRNANLSPLYCL
jgi:hypothetical protein